MRLLLDTHILLWALIQPDRLSQVARAAIVDRDNSLHVSAASAWEIATKHRIGKLPEARAVVLGYADHLTRLGATSMPITDRLALDAGTFEWDHRDPFDRLLAVQAIHESATLVTVDTVFSGVPGLRTLS